MIMNLPSVSSHPLRSLTGTLLLSLALPVAWSHAEQPSPSPASSLSTASPAPPAPPAPPSTPTSTIAPTPTPTPEPSPEKLTRKEAARLFHKAVHLQQGIGGTPDPVKARELYFRAARAGDPRAMQNLGVMLLAGAGVPADPAEGYRWIRSGADAGDPKALFSCALLLRQGVGTAKDPVAASSMMQRSADLGYVPALVSLADDSLSGENGMTKDPKLAVGLLLRAAKAGHDGAAFRISGMYREGIGFAKDGAKADEWLRNAARLGNSHAQFLYAHKMMVLKGPQAAYPWVKLAKDAGYVPVIGMYYEITGLMTPEQIIRGDKEAAAIKAAYPPVAQ